MNIKEVSGDISDILITKVLLCTLDCVPAYDEYFKNGVVKYNITIKFLSKSTKMICDAIHTHSEKEVVHSDFNEVLIDADVFQHCLYNPMFEVMANIDRFEGDYAVDEMEDYG